MLHSSGGKTRRDLGLGGIGATNCRLLVRWNSRDHGVAQGFIAYEAEKPQAATTRKLSELVKNGGPNVFMNILVRRLPIPLKATQ